jgi:hypothetical protein
MTALPRGSGPPLTWKVSVPRGDRLGQRGPLCHIFGITECFALGA